MAVRPPLRTAPLALLFALACKSGASPPPEAPVLPDLQSADSKKLLAAVDQLSGQVKDKPKSFEVLAALGNLYYENGRYLEAVDAFRLALEKSRKVEERAAALRAKGVKPAAQPPLSCRRSGPQYGLEQIAAQAEELEAKDPRAALRCDLEALSAATAVRARRANALYLIGQPEGALREHERVLAGAKDYPESLFFVGAITLEQSRGDKEKIAEGKRYWKRLLAVAPDHPRAAIVRESLPRAEKLFARAAPAGGAPAAGSLPPGHPPLVREGLPANHPSISGNEPGSPLAHRGGDPVASGSGGPSPEAVRGVAEAVAQTERTPELEKGLDELTVQAEALLDQGKYAEARDALVRVMPMRPQDARTAADLGAAMRGLGRSEMAERVLSRALELDPRQPRALYELGRVYAARGDRTRALEKLRAVEGADAAFARAHGVTAEIARLR